MDIDPSTKGHHQSIGSSDSEWQRHVTLMRSFPVEILGRFLKPSTEKGNRRQQMDHLFRKAHMFRKLM
jgi:hypothetical protein